MQKRLADHPRRLADAPKPAAIVPGARRAVHANTKDPGLVRARREQLVRAALKVFHHKGFHNATVRDIGRVAGLTQGTIYNYVRSKDDILFLVCDHIVTEYLASVRRAAAAEGDGVRRLEVALRGIAEVMIDQQSTILLLYHESHNLDRRSLRVVLGRVGEFIDSVEDLLAATGGAKRLGKTNRRLAANILTFLPTMVALRGWALPPELGRAQLVDEMVTFMLKGLGLARG